MPAASPNNDLLALIEQVRVAGDQSAWRTIQSKLAGPVRAAIQQEWGEAPSEIPPEPDIPRRIELRFWRMQWRARNILPALPDLFRSEITRRAGAYAKDAAAEHRRFQELLEQCNPETEQILHDSLPAADASQASSLNLQVHVRLWDIRHRLPTDCKSFNELAAETARETARISTLFRRSLAGERRAMDELFTIFQEHMVEVCRSAFPEIREDERKDILQDAMLNLFSGMPRTLDPSRVSTWRGFLRTVVYHAGIDWLRANGRYFNPADAETRKDV